MTLEEFAKLIEPISMADMGKLFVRFDLDSMDDAIERARADQQAANQQAEVTIQALMAEREALRRQALGL